MSASAVRMKPGRPLWNTVASPATNQATLYDPPIKPISLTCVHEVEERLQVSQLHVLHEHHGVLARVQLRTSWDMIATNQAKLYEYLVCWRY